MPSLSKAPWVVDTPPQNVHYDPRDPQRSTSFASQPWRVENDYICSLPPPPVDSLDGEWWWCLHLEVCLNWFFCKWHLHERFVVQMKWRNLEKHIEILEHSDFESLGIFGFKVQQDWLRKTTPSSRGCYLAYISLPCQKDIKRYEISIHLQYSLVGL